MTAYYLLGLKVRIPRMADHQSNPFRAPEPEPEPIDFQDADDKPWLRSESRSSVLGSKLGLAILFVVGIAGVVIARYYFGRVGGWLAAIVFLALIRASR